MRTTQILKHMTITTISDLLKTHQEIFPLLDIFKTKKLISTMTALRKWRDNFSALEMTHAMALSVECQVCTLSTL